MAEDKFEKKSSGNQELTEEEIRAKKQEEVLRRKLAKIDRSCRSAITRLGSVQITWFFALLIFIASFVLACIKFTPSSSGSSWWIMNNSKFAASASASVFFMLISTSRLLGNSNVMKRWKGIKKYRKTLPDNADWMIREIYIFYSCRKCIHFWMTALVFLIGLLSSLYVCVAVLVDMAVSQGTPSNIKVFSENFFKPDSWEVSNYIFVGGIGLALASAIQYILFKDGNDKALYALEEKYGRDKLVTESLWFARVSKVNFKYKSFVFVIVCLFGCLFYLFFKRLLCTIFDKSFVI